MRLICPNCGAQYEVDERVLPDAGRDVQCSNCGHAWFQQPDGHAEDENPAETSVAEAVTSEPDLPAETEEDGDGDAAGQEDDLPDEPEDTTEDAISQMMQDEPEDEVEDESETDTVSDDDSEDQGGDVDGEYGSEPETESEDDEQNTPQRQDLDDGVRDILREEAERESQAREEDREQLEHQEDLGLDNAAGLLASGGEAAQERMARLRGLDVEDDTNASGGGNARRDLLPDIEEINSSLDSIGSEDIVDDFAEATPRRGSFSRGFIVMVVLAVLIVVLYIYADGIGEKIPAIAPVLDGLVGAIDQLRAWLDGLVKAALSKLQSEG